MVTECEKNWLWKALYYVAKIRYSRLEYLILNKSERLASAYLQGLLTGPLKRRHVEHEVEVRVLLRVAFRDI